MSDDVPREVLPIPDRQWVGLTTYDAKDPDTTFPPINPVRPPKGAPNVLIILLDDVGFGRRARSVDPATRPRSIASPTMGCATPGSTPPRSVHRRGRLS